MRAPADSWFPEQPAGHAGGVLVAGSRPRLCPISVRYSPALSDLPYNRCLNGGDGDLYVDDGQGILAWGAAATRVPHSSDAEHTHVCSGERAGVERNLARRRRSISYASLFILKVLLIEGTTFHAAALRLGAPALHERAKRPGARK